MKNKLILWGAVLLLGMIIQSSCPVRSQCDPSGNWMAHLESHGNQIEIGIHIEGTLRNWSGFLISPDQTVEPFPFDTVILVGDTLRMTIKKSKIKVEGVLSRSCDSLVGSWKQGSAEAPLIYLRVSALPDLSRPQEPHPPYPYKSEEVSFVNKKAKITLQGTLTYPEGTGPFPALILITGSGPQNRDEELLGHKPFLLIADYLTRHGFAVLRFDDRGTGKSEGDFASATSFDFAEDVSAAFDFLSKCSQVDAKRIGLIGHSEGGMIAPIVAAKNKKVAAIVLLAGPGTTGKQILLSQAELIGKADGSDEKKLQENLALARRIYDCIETAKNKEQMAEQIRNVFNDQIKEMSPEEIEKEGWTTIAMNSQIATLTSDWFTTFVKFDPRVWLKKVQCPVLALNGEKDLQVPAKENLTAIEYALEQGKCTQFQTLAFEGLNHLFQPCSTGSPSEYIRINVTMSEDVLKAMEEWLRKILMP